MSELKLEVGKKYVNRAGEVIEIIQKDKDVNWPYVDSNGDVYEECGYFCDGISWRELDLIEEYIVPDTAKDEPKQNTSYTIDGLTMNIKQKGNKTKLKFGNGYSYPGETAATLTDTGNGYICKFKSQSITTQDSYVCLDYSQANDLYLLLKTVLAETIAEGENNE